MNVIATTAAADHLLDELRAEFGTLMFHLSGGCCDGSQPMCFPTGEFKVGASDVLLGMVKDTDFPFYLSADQYTYWKYSHLTLDVVPGRGSSFSLEIPKGLRFIIRSRLLTETELSALNADESR